MPHRREVMVFALKVLVVSFAVAAAVWLAPEVGTYSLRNSMLAIPAASIILCASAATWRRKAVYAGAMLGVFVSVDLVFVASGLLGSVSSSFGQRVGASALGIAYGTLVATTPVVALVLFLRKDPSNLWSRGRG